MAHELEPLLQRLHTEAAVLVTVAQARGSVPREAGAWMAVFARDCLGTIGGGHLEWAAQRLARERLAAPVERSWLQTVALGPSLGQCCGGRLALRYEHIDAGDEAALRERLGGALTPLALFGGGHVGRALVQALAPLPFGITWIDSRDEVFPDALPPQVRTEHADPVQSAVGDLAPGSLVLVMSFSHAEDLDIVAACLRRRHERADLPFVGLIGSRSKWATFRHRLAARDFSEQALDGVTSPIGLPGIDGKEPAVIAASVVAQLLLVSQAGAGAHGHR